MSITLLVLAQTDLWITGMLREQSEVRVCGAVRLPGYTCFHVAPDREKRTRQTGRALHATATVAALPAFFALTLSIVGAEPMVRIIYGEYYATGASILVALSLSQVVNIWSGSCGYALMMTGHQIAMMKISICYGVISIASAFYLAPGLGGLGAAISVSFALALQNILMMVAAKRNLGILTQIDIRLIWQQLSRPHTQNQ